jgi:regulatory protein
MVADPEFRRRRRRTRSFSSRVNAESDARPRPRESAHSYALKLLAMRGYSTRDLRRKLERRDYSPDESAQTVESLMRSGLLDDARFAEQYARSRMVNDSASPRRVVQLLSRYGIPRALAEQAVTRVIETEQLEPSASAEALARKKAVSLKGLEPAVARRRLFAYLARRGFDLEHIRSAVSSAIGGL